MSYINISKVVDLRKATNYVLQETKTQDHLVTAFKCERDSLVEEFRDTYEKRKMYAGKDTKNKARMIIQSFDPDDNVSPEHAHEMGVEFARRYLGDNYQYLVTTHIDNNQAHNHIIFNEVNLETYKMFDTKRSNTNTRLHNINDEISRENNLNVIKKSKVKKTSFTQREYVARAKGISFKEELERTIDENITLSSSYEEFLNLMKNSNYEIKEGQYLSFKKEDWKKFIRSKTLGIHYTEESIKYRINNPEFTFAKIKPIMNNQWIDKSEAKFQESRGLHIWASKQNINYLQELGSLVINEQLTVEEVEEVKNIQEKIKNDIENKIHDYDKKIFKAEASQNCYKDFRESAQLIADYKKAKDKAEFKRSHYAEFKKFDKAKKDINYYKKHFSINSEEEFMEYINKMYEERFTIYKEYSKQVEKEEKLRQQKENKKKKTI